MVSGLHSQITHELENAVFDMVVAGRVADDDVAIMMVEAEATAKTIELIKGGASSSNRRSCWHKALMQQSHLSRLSAKHNCSLAKVAAKPTAEFPVFLDYQDDVFAAVEAGS
jgi:polyribonucleotide nucleotidyltransferase